MGFVKLDDDLETLAEEQIATEGEWDLRITGAKIKRTSNDDRDMIEVFMAIEAPDDYQMLSEYIVLPNENDRTENNGKLSKMFLRNLKRFMHIFNIPFTAEGFEVEDFVGATGTLLLKVEDYKGQDQNKIVIPRIREE